MWKNSLAADLFKTQKKTKTVDHKNTHKKRSGISSDNNPESVPRAFPYNMEEILRPAKC